MNTIGPAMPSALSAAVRAVREHLAQYEEAATRLANGSETFLDDVVQMKKAEAGVKIGAAVARAAMDTQGYILDALA
jgi:flagellar hook-basal body complex protein FliE